MYENMSTLENDRARVNIAIYWNVGFQYIGLQNSHLVKVSGPGIINRPGVAGAVLQTPS